MQATVGVLMDTHAGFHIPVGSYPPLGLDGMVISVIDFPWVPAPGMPLQWDRLYIGRLLCTSPSLL